MPPGTHSEVADLRRRARLTGAIYIPYFFAAFPLALRAKLIVPNDISATATNIVASQTLYRVTILTDLMSYALYIALAYLFYSLLRNVNRSWAAIGALFTVAGCIVLIVVTGALTAPLLLLTGNAAHALALPERQELGLLAIRLYSQCYAVALLLFGLQWLIMGPLFARLIPRLIGWWLFAGGIGWVALSSLDLVDPALVPTIRTTVMAVGGFSELALGLWLLIKGVDTSRLVTADAAATT